jgi:hypothetical protein
VDVYGKTYEKELKINVLPAPLSDTNCLQLNNSVTNQYLRSDSIASSGIDFAGSFTVSFWINADYSEMSSFSHFALATQGGNSKAFLYNGTGGQSPRYYIYGTGGNKNYTLSGAPNPHDSTWHHIVMTWDFSGGVANSYIDGVVYNKSFFTNNTITAMLSVDSLLIGSRLSGPTAVSKGKFRHFSMWNTALSQSNVTSLSTSGSPTNLKLHSAASSLRAWYDLQSLTGSDTITDISGYGNDLTAINIDSVK